MEEVLYLIHGTDDPNCVNWNELKVPPFSTDDQFPGVYFSVITKDNINKEDIFESKYIMIFSKRLLLQNNYHMNLRDYNGIISEKNTYFPWNLDAFINNIKHLLPGETVPHNEVVFHDSIGMNYCWGIINGAKQNINMPKNYFLPNMSLAHKGATDKTKKPFFCYPFEHMYTGVNPLPRSSNKWYEMMAKVCNIPIDKQNNTREDIIKKIRDKAEELYNNRDKQDIKLLKKYTKAIIEGKSDKSKKTKNQTLRKNKIKK